MRAPLVRTVPPQLESCEDLQILFAEMACALTDAEAALFSGRFRDLENSARRQQEVCARIEELVGESRKRGKPFSDRVVAIAERARRQNLIFAAVLRRARRHLETLARLLTGPALSYGRDVVAAVCEER